MLEWSTAAPAIGAAFLASLVEVVEAFTIVLVVATLRGWKPAVLGTGAALATLAAVVVILGPLLDRVPLNLLQLVIGVLLLLFGIGWLRKASLRASGVLPLHDEDAVFAKESAELTDEIGRQKTSHGLDRRDRRLQGGASRRAGSHLYRDRCRGRGQACCGRPASALFRPVRWSCWSGQLLIARCRKCRKTRSSSVWVSCCRPSVCSGPVKA